MPQNPNEMIKSPNRILTIMEPALPRIHCIMARHARFGGRRGRLTSGNPGGIVGRKHRHGPVWPQLAQADAHATWSLVAWRTQMPERKQLVAGNWKMNGRRA